MLYRTMVRKLWMINKRDPEKLKLTYFFCAIAVIFTLKSRFEFVFKREGRDRKASTLLYFIIK